MTSLKTKGFIILELIVVFAIIAIISGFLIAGFRDYYLYQSYNQAVTSVKTTLVDARIKARSSEGGQAHGVKILTSSLVLFPGTTYNAGNSSNITVPLEGVTLNPELTAGADLVVFNNLSGMPTATGTIEIIGLSHLATTTVEITDTGVIQ